ARVGRWLRDRRTAAFRAVPERAGLPLSVYPAFRAAIEAMHDDGIAEPGGATRLKRRMVERVLTSCAGLPAGEVEPLLTLLRRYATEAAREEARLFCDELVDMGNVVVANDTGRAGVGAESNTRSVHSRESGNSAGRVAYDWGSLILQPFFRFMTASNCVKSLAAYCRAVVRERLASIALEAEGQVVGGKPSPWLAALSRATRDL